MSKKKQDADKEESWVKKIFPLGINEIVAIKKEMRVQYPLNIAQQALLEVHRSHNYDASRIRELAQPLVEAGEIRKDYNDFDLEYEMLVANAKKDDWKKMPDCPLRENLKDSLPSRR